MCCALGGSSVLEHKQLNKNHVCIHSCVYFSIYVYMLVYMYFLYLKIIHFYHNIYYM